MWKFQSIFEFYNFTEYEILDEEVVQKRVATLEFTTALCHGAPDSTAAAAAAKLSSLRQTVCNYSSLLLQTFVIIFLYVPGILKFQCASVDSKLEKTFFVSSRDVIINPSKKESKQHGKRRLYNTHSSSNEPQKNKVQKW